MKQAGNSKSLFCYYDDIQILIKPIKSMNFVLWMITHILCTVRTDLCDC